MKPTFSVRLDYKQPLEMDARGAEILETLSAASLGLMRVAASTQRERTSYEDATPERLRALISSGDYFELSLESPGKELENRASLALKPRRPGETITCSMSVVLTADHQRVVDLAVRLADALGTSAGFLAVEPNPSLAYKLAVGSSMPTARDGLSDVRRRARRAYDKWYELVDAKIATIEWGTFLGERHLQQLSLDDVRRSRAFDQVELASSSLAFLRVTSNPLDDLSGELERRLQAARGALGPLLVDSSEVKLDS